MGKIINILLISSVVYISIKINSLFKPPPIPKLEDTWWGPGQPTAQDASIKPFKIFVENQVLEDLRHRLNGTTRLTPPLEGIQQQYGMNTKLLAEVVEYWKTKYNWRDREEFLNQYPQFVTNIQGLQIHFLHIKPVVSNKELKVVPLLLLHGWPGSVCEFYKIIPLLTTPRDNYNFVFELIIPSLPGYAFSQGASKPGLGAGQMAVMFKNLMKRLEFDKFYVQGGDWGAIIGSIMAAVYPEHIYGHHSNMCFSMETISNIKIFLGSLYPPLIVDKKYEDRMYPLSNMYSNLLLGTGYMHLQATKPDTIGVVLNDSPVGLAAYILEKFTIWTVPEWINREDGGLTIKYTYEELLDNIMLYWVTSSITTSVRLYAETVNLSQMSLGLQSIPIKVPSACSKFRNEISFQPDTVLRDKYHNLVEITQHIDGGHFAAFEVPEVLAKDIWSAISKMEILRT